MPRLFINMIRVGTEHFDTDDVIEMASAVQFMKATYATVGISVDEVRYWPSGIVIPWGIRREDAQGFDFPEYVQDAVDLTNTFTFPYWAVDVFVVKWFDSELAGYSPIPGPCDKNAATGGMTGSVVELNPPYTGGVLAHELGHYLGLSDRYDNSNNLMYWMTPNGGQLESWQGAIMRSHCFVLPD